MKKPFDPDEIDGRAFTADQTSQRHITMLPEGTHTQ
jgi:hypothetical protein